MKNYLLGVGFLILAFYLIWQQGSEQMDYAEQRSTNQASVEPILPIADNPSISKNGQVVQSDEPSAGILFESVQELGQEKLSAGLASELSSV
ncbi:MAG: hypothetical protein VW907_06820, partial [Opitutae bacterium]